MKESEVDALIRLIDDPDDQIYLQIRERLISFGQDVIPTLENVWEHNEFGLLFQSRIEDIIHLIQFQYIKDHLADWAKDGGKDLLEGVLLVNAYQYPDLDKAGIQAQIDQIRQDVWLELNDRLTAFEKIRIINHILYDVHEFTGNKQNFHAPQNSYLNNVLETKKGNPLSLSIIYMTIAQQLNIPIYGINLPNHFVLAYQDSYEGSDQELFFYINPFSRGTIFHRREIDDFLRQLKLEAKPSFYTPCTNLQIVKRLLHNLVHSYDKLGYPDKVNDLQQLLDAVSTYG